jgi:hypothetical protein
MPLEVFAAFDAPAMTDANCASRPVTTVSPQSLLLMNNLYMREHAQDLAQRVTREAGAEVEAQVQRAWRLCYGRSPSMAELGRSRGFYESTNGSTTRSTPPSSST